MFFLELRRVGERGGVAGVGGGETTDYGESVRLITPQPTTNIRQPTLDNYEPTACTYLQCHLTIITIIRQHSKTEPTV